MDAFDTIPFEKKESALAEHQAGCHEQNLRSVEIMKRSTKAALLSALVFPGVGHLFLRQYLRGAALLALTMTGVTIILVKSVQRALPIVEKIQNGDVALEAQALSELLSKSASGSEGLLLNLASLALLFCWIIGIVDSYRIGHRQE